MDDLKQEIYDHGGSRIYYESGDEVYLIADTYIEDEAFSVAVKEFINEYLDKVGERGNVRM